MTRFSWMLFILLCFLGSACSNQAIDQENINWDIRDSYEENGETLLQVYPDTGLVAGESLGYLFHFTAPFETFKGKELAIYLHNKETGESIIAVAPKEISEPPSGYSSLERYTAYIEVPYGGIWRYEVRLDDKSYADIVLDVYGRNSLIQINE